MPLLAALAFLTSCAHAELTGEEHRAAAAAEMRVADKERSEFDPNASAMVVQPRSPFAEDATVPRFYNPSAEHLIEADERMKSAFKHLEAARKLETYEDAACAGISQAERMSCPLIAPHLEKVEEGAKGVVLHLKTAERAAVLAGQMKCHLAFAQSSNFERVPCPLYIKGVSIGLVGDKTIEVTSTDVTVARRIREEARRMFGEGRST